jgi:ABC-2 type transport system permease protein
MLLDALKAEQFRLLRDRGAVLWGFVFPGVGVFLLGILATLFVKLVARQHIPGAENLFSDATGALTGTGSPITQIFFLIGAAAIFGTDYRWETWRLQTPRNSRLNLIVAKFGVYALAVVAALIIMALAGVLAGVVRAMIEHLPLAPVDLSIQGPQFLRAFLGSWLEMLVVGAVAALISVATRNAMAAVIVTLLLAFAQAIIMGQVHLDPVHPPLDALAIFPALSADVIRGGPVGPRDVTAQGAEAATLFISLWIVVLVAAIAVLFQRQELTRE